MARNSGRKVILTQMHMSLSFFFIFVAYQSLENIQSSLNFEAGLGTISISLVYAGYLCSSFFVGSPVVYLITPKWALFTSFFCHTLFIIANYWPVWGTMIPASLILGVGAGPYWIAQGTYSTVLAVKYASITGESLDRVTATFSGIFYVFWGASKPVGNMITSIILNQDNANYSCNVKDIRQNNTILTGHNMSLNTNDSCNSTTRLQFCGPNHCPYMEEHQESLDKPDTTLIYIMISVFLGFNIIGIITAGLLRNVPATKQSSIGQRLLSIIKVVKEPNLLLLILPSCLVGIIPGTYYATFAQSVISCIFGIGMVGYAMVCEGIAFAVASLVCGPLTKYIARWCHVTLTLITFLTLAVWFLFWNPHPSQFWAVCIVAVIYGSMHGTFRTHISGLVSLLFPFSPEAAFAHYNIWMGVGFSASFAYSNFLCYNVKIYIFIIMIIMAALSYGILEWRIKFKGHKQHEKKDSATLQKVTEPLM